jgi:hypothetical protein
MPRNGISRQVIFEINCFSLTMHFLQMTLLGPGVDKGGGTIINSQVLAGGRWPRPAVMKTGSLRYALYPAGGALPD